MRLVISFLLPFFFCYSFAALVFLRLDRYHVVANVSCRLCDTLSVLSVFVYFETVHPIHALVDGCTLITTVGL